MSCLFWSVIGAMPRKQTISFLVNPALASRFREMTKAYYGKLGLCFSAAMLQFLESDPKTQADLIQRVFKAELEDEVEELLDTVQARQARHARVREPKDKR